MGHLNTKFARLLDSVSSFQDDSAEFKRTQNISVTFGVNVVTGLVKATINGNCKSWQGEGKDFDEAFEAAKLSFKSDVDGQIKKLAEESKKQIEKLKTIRI